MQTAQRTNSTITSPVDDETYNLLQSLTSKLEGIDSYRKYVADGGETAEMFDRLAREDAEHATQLLDALRTRLGG